MNSNQIKPVVGLLTILILSFLPVNVAYSQNTFNGKMEFKIQDQSGKTVNVMYYCQDGNMRMDLPGMGQKGYIISRKKETYVVMPAQKMYMQYSGDFSKMMNSNPMMQNSQTQKNKLKDTTDWMKIWEKAKTGNTKTILGYKCDEFVVRNNDGSSIHIWATKDLGTITIMNTPMSSNIFLHSMQKIGTYFPLLTEDIGPNGKVISKFQVAELKRQKLDDNLFKVPEGFKKMNIPGMKF